MPKKDSNHKLFVVNYLRLIMRRRHAYCCYFSNLTHGDRTVIHSDLMRVTGERTFQGPWLARTLGIVSSVAALLLIANPSRANTISFSDLTDGTPGVSTDIAGAIVVKTTEMAMITTTLLSGAPAGGIRSVLLTEPGAGGTVSDFVTLMVTGGGLPGLPSTVTLLFESDEAPGFAAAASLLLASHAPTITETGGLQNLSSLLNSGPLTIQVQSYVGGVSDAGSTVILLGLALLAIAAFRRKRALQPVRVCQIVSPRRL